MRHPGLPASLGLAVLAAAGYALYCSTRDRRSATPPAKPEHLQTWEGEGGSVPVGTGRTAAQVYAESSDSRPGA
jgi:hypothetical protein